MKVLLLSQYYPPENTLITPTLARYLRAAGHQVRVLTGYPNYPEGRVFDGYSQRWRSRELIDGVDVLRVPLWADHSQRTIRRTLNYTSFALSAATARRFIHDADVVYIYATQMAPALGPWLWRLLSGAPYILHIQDLWPDSIIGSSIVQSKGLSRMVPRIMNPWLASVYRRAAAIIGIAPTMVQTLIDRGTDPKSTYLIYNWAEEESLSNLPVATTPAQVDTGQTRLLYGGNIGDMQDLDNVITAVHNSRDAGIHLTVLGDGVALPRIKALAESLDMMNVDFKGRVPRSEMGSHYAAADFSLVTLKDLPNFRGTIPSKFQAALSHGTPVITTVQGDLRRIVEDLRIGFTAEAESAHSLESALRDAAQLSKGTKDEMAERAKAAYGDRFSQKAGLSAIESLLQNIAAG